MVWWQVSGPQSTKLTSTARKWWKPKMDCPVQLVCWTATHTERLLTWRTETAGLEPGNACNLSEMKISGAELCFFWCEKVVQVKTYVAWTKVKICTLYVNQWFNKLCGIDFVKRKPIHLSEPCELWLFICTFSQVGSRQFVLPSLPSQELCRSCD